MRKSDPDRFWSKVDKSGDCWIWTGAIFQHKQVANKYGMFALNRRPYRAHRYSYETQIGPIPDGLYVCHTCDNPICVKPPHLFLGTAQDNVDDMLAKGRSNTGKIPGKGGYSGKLPPRVSKGENSVHAKLTQFQVDEIRSLAAMGGVSQRDLARKFNVGRSTIRHILDGNTCK